MKKIKIALGLALMVALAGCAGGGGWDVGGWIDEPVAQPVYYGSQGLRPWDHDVWWPGEYGPYGLKP